MQRSLAAVALLLCALGARASGQAPSHYVFAHYMVACPTYGATLEGYEREIQEAQANGIDGFALNCGDWSHDSTYKNRCRLIFLAAEQLGTSFKLFLCPSWPGFLSCMDIRDMVLTFGGSPNYFTWQGQAVLSGYNASNGGTQKDAWWLNNVLTPLQQLGHPVFFIPNSHLVPDNAQTSTATVQAAYDAWWSDVAGGVFYFGAAGLPVDDADGDDMDNTWHVPALIAAGKSYASVLHHESLLYMAPVSPQYWGDQQDGRRYFEYQGGEGLAAQWNAIIASAQPDWIELVTWNDWNEATYFSPVDDFAAHSAWPAHEVGFYQTHRGLSALQRYYIAWYKAGSAPAITRDDVFYAYRTHPSAAMAADDPDPVEDHYGPVADDIYVTTMLTAPADLHVITGGTTRIYSGIAAGIVHTRVPFNTGSQVFELWRGGARLWRQEGAPIGANPAEYNFEYYSGSTLTSPPGPTGLTAVPSSGQVILAWNPFAGAVSYNVKSYNPADGSTTTLSTGVTTATWTDANAVNGTTTWYVVSAVTANGEGSNSDPISATPCGTGIVVDNADASGVTVTGSWSSSSGAGQYGTNFLYDDGAGGGKSVRFTPIIPTTGLYQVYARWTTDASRASNVPIDITSASGTQTVTVDQQQGNAQWILLGTYPFNAGVGGSVTIRDDGAVGYVIADAVQFVPAPIVKDNADPTGILVTGYWPVGNSPGYYGTNYLQDANAGATGGKSVRFTPALLATGNYRVYLRWAQATNRATNTPVDVVSADGTDTQSFNQQIGGGKWNYVGTYSFAAGTAGYVNVRDDHADGYVIADAVQFVPD